MHSIIKRQNTILSVWWWKNWAFLTFPSHRKVFLRRDPDAVKTGSLVCFSLGSCQQRLVVMCDCHGRLEVKELWRRSVWDAQALPCHCLLFYLWLKVTEYLPPRPLLLFHQEVLFCLLWLDSAQYYGVVSDCVVFLSPFATPALSFVFIHSPLGFFYVPFTLYLLGFLGVHRSVLLSWINKSTFI